MSLEHDYDVILLKEPDNEYYEPVRKLIESYQKKTNEDFYEASVLMQSK